MLRWKIILSARGLLLVSLLSEADIPDEFRIKRESVFEFTQKPVARLEGDKVTVSFETRAYCDATVAIENSEGRIIRHLASGVLGPNAPPPFQKNSRRQTIVWDGKDDQDVYVDNKAGVTVRVALGLKPRFERTLYWSPYKRISQAAPLVAANEEGVFVCEGWGIDSIRMYDHDGNYVRTVYPFPKAKLADVKGLEWRDFPQGLRLPWKHSLYQQTVLTSGDNCNWWDLGGMSGRAATGMAVNGRRLVLANLKLNRLATDGTSGGLDLGGGFTSFEIARMRSRDSSGKPMRVTPTSVALSPDNRWVYLAGYAYRLPYNFDTMHGVARMPLDGSEDASVFLGKLECPDGFAGGAGSGPGEFKNASSVDCDACGRVYVADFMNDRIQIFSPDGSYLKEIPTFKPAVVRVNRRNGQIWVISWMIPSRLWSAAEPAIEISPTVAVFGSFEEPRELSRRPLPMGNIRVKANGKYGTYTGLSHALWFTAEIDFHTDPVTLWIGRECRNDAEAGVHPGDGGQITPWETAGIRVLRDRGTEFELVKDFGVEAKKQAVRARPPMNAIQRLEVNPVNGRLYVGEADSGPTGKASTQLLEINPETGEIKIVELPFNAMEFVFDLNGLIYLRNTDMIVRYDSVTFREIPFDYGESRPSVGRDGGIGGRSTPVIGGLPLPSKSPVCYHQGGINVNALGKVIASCAYRFEGVSGKHYALDKNALEAQGGKPYTPTIYPGRISTSTSPCIHVWNKHGQVVYEDAVPGVGQVDGVALDRDDNIYFMHTANRFLNGKPYFNRVSETLTKVKPRNGLKIVTKDEHAPVPVSETELPKREPDILMGGSNPSWVESAEWLYGGVGFAGFNAGHAPACACWFSRFTLDYFARSIVPEPALYSVAVIDSAGNLILRMGKCGNVDDGVPLVKEGGPPAPNPVGGDEVALFYACYTGTHTDRRIFISDVGNGRILSVRLDYYAEERIPLRELALTQG
ncbi:MAG: hypothetical protein N2255_04410, partial [Kiritimatiellae bacterium]|nr:hypothetical protein [Kiritimatiellia bacterium]